MTGIDAALLSKAIVVWTGFGSTRTPSRDEARLVERFGNEAAVSLFPLVLQAEKDFYSSDARDTVAGLRKMSNTAAAEFCGRRPELSRRAVRALAWCYAWDNK